MTDPPRRPGFADRPSADGSAAARGARAAERRPSLLSPQEGQGAVVASWAPRELGSARRGLGTLGLVAAGGVVLIVAWAAFGLASMVASQFDASPLLGWLSLGAVGAGAGLIGAAIWREARALRSLARVDELRAALADPAVPLARARAASLDWVRDVALRLPEAGRVVPAIEAARSVEEITAHLRAGVVVPLAAEAARIGRHAAVEGGAVVALSPSPALDAALALWRGLAVVREVAALHGLRPGVAATQRLLARTASIAATTAGADLLAQGAAERLLGATPIIKELAATVPGASVAAFRLYRLAVATAAACSPLPPR
jgi:putative membrane protein